jgi:hypothetical protein
MAVDHHHERVHAIDHFLSIPFNRRPLRDLETMLQSQARLHVKPLLIGLELVEDSAYQVPMTHDNDPSIGLCTFALI